jgi:hypothetical protein
MPLDNERHIKVKLLTSECILVLGRQLPLELRRQLAGDFGPAVILEVPLAVLVGAGVPKPRLCLHEHDQRFLFDVAHDVIRSFLLHRVLGDFFAHFHDL